MNRYGIVSPRIFQPLTTIRDVNKLHVQLACGIFKTPRLIAQFRGEEQQTLGRVIRFR